MTDAEIEILLAMKALRAARASVNAAENACQMALTELRSGKPGPSFTERVIARAKLQLGLVDDPHQRAR